MAGQQKMEEKAFSLITIDKLKNTRLGLTSPPSTPTMGLTKPSRQAATMSMSISISPPTTPTGGLTKPSTARYNCLCSPTTHAGSFRCRYHRHRNTGGLTRSSMSVGSKLSELATKSSGMCTTLHAQ